VITGLIATFSDDIAADERISADVEQQVQVQLAGAASFVATDQVERAADEAGLDDDTAAALVENYENAQLDALKTAILFAAFIVTASFWLTRRLPDEPFVPPEAAPA
jgi:hypothetical protein